jgi:CBS domain-containing protein
MRQIREVMTSELVCVGVDDAITEAARLMREHDVGLLPVTNGGDLVGVITDRDIVIRAVAEGKLDESVGSIVSTSVVTLSPDDDERVAVTAMSEHDVRRLPVVEGSRLVGMVSVGDIATRADSHLAGAVMKNTGPIDKPHPINTDAPLEAQKEGVKSASGS